MIGVREVGRKLEKIDGEKFMRGKKVLIWIYVLS